MVRDDKIHVYYCAHGNQDPYLPQQIGLATLRLDGFVSLDAPDPVLNTRVGMTGSANPNGPPPEAMLLTKPLWSTGNRLVANVDSRDYVTAELMDPDGRVYPGFGHEECDVFRGDSLRHTFSWRGRQDIGGLFPLRIRFRMLNTSLYALQVVEFEKVRQDDAAQDH